MIDLLYWDDIISGLEISWRSGYDVIVFDGYIINFYSDLAVRERSKETQQWPAFFIFKLKKSERANRHADRQSFFNRLAVVSASGCFSIVWHLVLLLGLSTKLHHLLYREYIARLNIVHSKEHKKNVWRSPWENIARPSDDLFLVVRNLRVLYRISSY